MTLTYTHKCLIYFWDYAILRRPLTSKEGMWKTYEMFKIDDMLEIRKCRR